MFTDRARRVRGSRQPHQPFQFDEVARQMKQANVWHELPFYLRRAAAWLNARHPRAASEISWKSSPSTAKTREIWQMPCQRCCTRQRSSTEWRSGVNVSILRHVIQMLSAIFFDKNATTRLNLSVTSNLSNTSIEKMSMCTCVQKRLQRTCVRIQRVCGIPLSLPVVDNPCHGPSAVLAVCKRHCVYCETDNGSHGYVGTCVATISLLRSVNVVVVSAFFAADCRISMPLSAQ